MNNTTFDQLPAAVDRLIEKLDHIEQLILKQHNRQPSENNNQLLTVPEAAEFLSLAVPTIYSMVCRGQLPYMKRSKRLYFSREELTAYIKAGRHLTDAEIQASAINHFRSNKKGPNNDR